MSCPCGVCSQYREFEKHLQGVPIESHEFFESLMDQLVETQMDLDVSRAIICGTWPGADNLIAQRRGTVL